MLVNNYFPNKEHLFLKITQPLHALSIFIYVFFGIISFACIKDTFNKIALFIMYMLLFLLEVWNILLIEYNTIFKLASFFLIFNVAFIYVYVIFVNEINVVIFNIIAMLSLLVISVVYYFMTDIQGKVHMVLNPYSCIVGCYFYVVWVGLFLYNKKKFEAMMFLKFPFEIFFEFGRILTNTLF